MKKISTVALIALAAVLLYFLAAGPSSKTPEGSVKAPPLSGPLLGGGRASLSDYAGKVVLVDFWATWCDPCREEIPDLVALHKKLSKDGFLVLGVSMDEEGESAVKRFTAKQPIPYPVLLNGSERAPAGWSAPGLPTAYLVGRDGSVLRRWYGGKDISDVERDARAAMAEPTPK